ncbi:MAG: DUF5074 domain-containing protein [Flavobacteriales bacterium]
MRFFHFLIALIFLSLVSCIKDKPPVDHNKVDLTSSGVYIVNEGNFQFGNASVSYYDIAANSAQEDVFKSVNNKALGDVAQSMYAANGRLYIVVNNSGKIEVVDTSTFISSGKITGLISPRFFVPVNSTKAYVSDYLANAISVVDLSTSSVSGSIPCTGWTEEILLSNGKVFVTNMQRDKVYVINTTTDVITDSIAVNYSSNSIQQDKNGKIWVLCGGDSKISGGLHRINPTTLKVEASFTFASGNPWRLKMNGSKDTLYFLNKGVYAFPITASALPSQALIAEGNRSYYGLGVDPLSGVIYVADAMDYVQKSTIYRYTANGTLLSSFKAGINSSDFYFKP